MFKLELAKCEGNDGLASGELSIYNKRVSSDLPDQIRAILLDAKKMTTNSDMHSDGAELNSKIHRAQNNARVGVPNKCGKPSTTLARPPPRYMADTHNPVYFLHIGKSGGTSIDSLFPVLLDGTVKTYHGKEHFDWSFIQQQQMVNILGVQRNLLRGGRNDDIEGFEVSSNADVVTFLRHPVSRAVSQFYFSKELPWMERVHEKAREQTIDEYLDDANKTWTQPIADGESGADFLAGIYETKAHRETDLKRYLRQNKTAAALFAASRLENTTWFGLMEDMDRSMKLLQLTLGLEVAPILPKENSKTGAHPKPSDETVKKIEKYIPKDLWLYEFAKRLFEARWEYFTGGNCVYVPPELPPLPDFKLSIAI